MAGLRALIIDDNGTNRRILEASLLKEGLSTVLAESGAAGLAAIEEQSFDLILLDVEMPGMDGFEVAAQIRRRWPDSAAKIVMLSSIRHQPGQERSRELRIEAFASKPVCNADLMDTLQLLFGGAAAGQPALPPAEPIDTRRHLKVLLAEDNAVNQALVRRILTRRGHTVTVVGDGRAAVDAFQRDSFDVILMDIEMPEMDGMEATARIRSQEIRVLEKSEHVPIIAVTARAMPGDRENFLNAGMDGYVTKPIQAAALFAEMAEVCRAQLARR